MLEQQNSSPALRLQESARSWGWTRVIVFALIFVSVVCVVVDGFTSQTLQDSAIKFFDWVAANPFIGVFVVIVVYAIGTILFLPGSILTIGTGYACGRAFGGFRLGVVVSSAAALVGATIGSICTFLIARYLFRDAVLALARRYPLVLAIDRAMRQKGFQIMLLLRLSALIPYNALDYISGVTSISFLAYAQALVGIIPGTVAFCAIGAAAPSLMDGSAMAQESPAIRIFVFVFGFIFAFGGVGLASYYAKIELERILSEEDPNGLLPIDGEPSSEYRDHPMGGDTNVVNIAAPEENQYTTTVAKS